ncbi:MULTISPECIES: hypothetical protein [Enterococcus]|uniref:Uncharacterized protein n=1 Tax=Enterococcus sulfureus ATCC 49903 TaxID=1140003 RepID=S0L6D2_9ENTE|nr:hypothetical protein [Enterococcus sulfureus]EOT47041.1 hypothetical protein OMY_01291 [Enterococcus sulfureus ATCC 49903]EOT83664.1 hypothetical protein I573_01389 [Enterococcus sulfureus ATCC 49903]
MAREMKALKFLFRNGETWTVDRRFIGDLWIKQITTSYGRINGGEFVEIHPCAGFKIEIFQEGDQVATHDINLGGLELGMFSRALKYQDIERMEILYRTGASEIVYFPYKDTDGDGLDNVYQSTKISESTKNLYIVIDPEKSVDDIYGQELK